MQGSRLYHNPHCSKSRAARELLDARMADLEVIDYLRAPPSSVELRRLLAMLGMTPRELLRTGESEYAALGLDRSDLRDEAVIEAMIAHPILIERPIFVHRGRAIVGRPPERVLELLA